MKIGITFFGSKLDLLCISKVLTICCVFSIIRLKKKRSRGHVACSPSARGSLSVRGSRAGALGELREGFSGTAHSESSREGFSGHGPLGELPGGALGARPRVTRGGLGSIRGSFRLGTQGQVSCSEASGESLTRCAF